MRESIDDLIDTLSDFLFNPHECVILFMGNDLRGDDGAGIVIGKEIIELFSDTPIRERLMLVYNVPVNFLGKIINKKPKRILMVDAIDIDQDAGTIALLSPEIIKNTNSTTTHYQEFDDLIKFISRELGYRPQILVLGIQVLNTDKMFIISKKVKDAIQKVVMAISTALKSN